MCDRHYTPAVVSQMQTIALVVELRRRLQINLSRRVVGDSAYDDGMEDGWIAAIEFAIEQLDELAPADYSQCDNPPPEAATLVDYAAGRWRNDHDQIDE
jgi:hypothetical protein